MSIVKSITLGVVLAFVASLSAQCPVEFGPAGAVAIVKTGNLGEASGLAASRVNPGVFWTHNDGNEGKLYAINRSGELLATYDLSVNVDDVEDIAIAPGPDGGDYLYLGDIGSNDSSRDHVKLVRAPEPLLTGVSASDPVKRTLKQVETFSLKYPAGKFDAEAMFVDPIASEFWIFTKLEGAAEVFRVPLSLLDPDHSVTLEHVRDLDFRTASGAAISRSGQWIALRREDYAELWTRQSNENLAQTFARPGVQIPVVGPPTEPNGEAIAFAPDESGYYTLSEGKDQPLYFFPASSSGSALRFAPLPRLTSQGWEIRVEGCPGTVAIERSDDLRIWQSLGTISLAAGSAIFVDPARDRVHFYRLRRL